MCLGLSVLDLSPEAIEKEWEEYVNGMIIEQLKLLNEKLSKLNLLLEDLVKMLDSSNFRLEELIKIYAKVNGL